MKVHGAPKSIAELGVILLDSSTGNGFGGIMLPQAAAPLGLYRGIDCHAAFSAAFDIANPHHYARPPLGSGDLDTGRANYVLESSAQFPAGALCRNAGGLEGLMTPYSVVDAALGTRYCRSLYPTRQSYSDCFYPRIARRSSRPPRHKQTSTPSACPHELMLSATPCTREFDSGRGDRIAER
jgi:hypothetical protein